MRQSDAKVNKHGSGEPQPGPVRDGSVYDNANRGQKRPKTLGSVFHIHGDTPRFHERGRAVRHILRIVSKPAQAADSQTMLVRPRNSTCTALRTMHQTKGMDRHRGMWVAQVRSW